MAGGQHGFTFTIFGLFGAAIVFGVPWLAGKILPFMESPSFGSTTGWVLCGVGGVAGVILAQIALTGWHKTWRSWATYALLVGSIYGIFAIAGWYIEANPDSALLETITELGQNMSLEPENLLLLLFIGIPVVFIGIPIVVTVIALAIALLKGNSGGDSGR